MSEKSLDDSKLGIRPHSPVSVQLKGINKLPSAAVVSDERAQSGIAGDGIREEYQEQNPVEEPTLRQAWFQALLSHLINFNSFGYILSFGIFQTYYREQLGFSPSNISWIGTMQLFLLFFVGVFSGRALDAGLYKNTLIAGITCQIIAVFATSFCTKYYQLFLAQGLLQGLGNGLLYCPAVALVSTYFPLRRRALALSVVASGGATGGMVFPAIARSLLDKIGFAWTIRVMGFVMLVVHGIVLPFSKTRPTSVRAKKDRAWLDPTAARDAPYLLFCIGIFLGFWGLFFAYFYVGSYGRDILGVSQGTSFTLLLVINCIGIPGRVVPNYLADRYFGSLNIEILFIFITGVLLMTWFAVHSITAFYAWVAVYGFFGGGCQSLFQSACSSFSTDPDKIGIRIGMVCTVVSFACLSGSPIAGRLLEAKEGRYLGAQIFGGVVMIIGSMFLLAARLAQCGRTTES